MNALDILHKHNLILDFQTSRIIAKHLGVDYQDILVHQDINIQQDLTSLESDLKKFQKNYPLDYILKEIQFAQYKFFLDDGCLIPREETEYIVLEFQKYLESRSSIFNKLLNLKLAGYSLVDLGCGCGVIGISLANLFDKVYLVDNYPAPINNTGKNIELHKKTNSNLQKSDLLSVFLTSIKLSNPWVLFANLPYVPESDIQNRDKFNTRFEPKEAIYATNNGLSLFQKTVGQIEHIQNLKSLTKTKPQLCIFELDPRNINKAKNQINHLYNKKYIVQDQNDLDRFLICLD